MISTTPAQERYTRFSCSKPGCAGFNRPGEGNIVHRSWIGQHRHIERLRCTACDREFSEREGTLMARSKLPEATVQQLLNCQRWGVCDEGTAAICAVELKTVQRFQSVAAHRAQPHQQQIVQQVDVQGVQLDEAHSKLRPSRVEWIHTALALGSWFLLGGAFGPRTQDTAAGLSAQVVARAQALPLLLTDGWKAYPVVSSGASGSSGPRSRPPLWNGGMGPSEAWCPLDGAAPAVYRGIAPATGERLGSWSASTTL